MIKFQKKFNLPVSSLVLEILDPYPDRVLYAYDPDEEDSP